MKYDDAKERRREHWLITQHVHYQDYYASSGRSTVCSLPLGCATFQTNIVRLAKKLNDHPL